MADTIALRKELEYLDDLMDRDWRCPCYDGAPGDECVCDIHAQRAARAQEIRELLAREEARRG